MPNDAIQTAIERIASKPLFDPQCVVSLGLGLFADRWSMLILLSLMQGTKRYGELQRMIPAVSPKMLAQTLRALERHGLVSREIFPEVPPRVEYTLTEFGQSLRLPLATLMNWSIERERDIRQAAESREKPSKDAPLTLP